MPKQRLQVDSGIAPGQLTAPAAPVNTFVQTAEGQKLAQLAQGLAQFAPALGRLSDVLTERKAQGDYASGQKKARELAQDAANFRDAIRKGAITPHQSPWFMAGLKEQFGRLAADRMNFEFTAAAAGDETLQNSTDTADFDKFAQHFTQQWTQDNLGDNRDLYVEKGFGARADAYLADAQRQFAAQLGSRVRNQMNDGHFAEVNNSVMTEITRGTSLDAIAQSIEDSTNSKIALGMNGRQLNVTTVAAVIAAAHNLAAHGDDRAFQALDLLMKIPGGPTGAGSLANQSYGADAYATADTQIGAELQGFQTRSQQRAQREQVAARDNFVTDMIDKIAENPNLDVQPFLQQMGHIDPEYVTETKGIWDAFTAPPSHSNETVRTELMTAIWNDPDRTAVTPSIIGAALARKQLTFSDAQSLIREWKTAHESGAELLLNESPVTTELSILHDTFVSENGGVRFMLPEDAQRLSTITANIKRSYITWRQTDGKASSYAERIDFMRKQTTAALSTLNDKTLSPDPTNMRAGSPGTAKPTPETSLTPEEKAVVLHDGVLNNAMTPALKAILTAHNIAPTPEAISAFLQLVQSQ